MTEARAGDVVCSVTCSCGSVWVRLGALGEYPEKCTRCGDDLLHGERRVLGPGGAL